jgi:hypothetical protein
MINQEREVLVGLLASALVGTGLLAVLWGQP